MRRLFFGSLPQAAHPPVLVALAALLLVGGAARADFQLLHSFDGSIGGFPYGPLTAGLSGTIYGTTQVGGAYGKGTLYRLDPSGSISAVYNFKGSANPRGALAVVTKGTNAGTVYGITYRGGAYGYGTLYKIRTTGALTTLTTLHDFTSVDGHPTGGVIRDSKGTLYGTTREGGKSGKGMVYRFDTRGLTPLASFRGYNGANPNAALFRDSKGNLYGTTFYGGAYDKGTVFEISATGLLTTLHSFTGDDGSWPASSLVQDSASNLYGTTQSGGYYNYGTVFRLTSSGLLTTLHDFTGSLDGAGPSGGLRRDSAGNLYGTTGGG